MREIKLKAYEMSGNKVNRVLENVGFHPSLIQALHMDPDSGYKEGEEDYIISPAFINYRLVEYINQKDKNRKEIYNGDIIRRELSSDITVAVVVFCEKYSAYMWIPIHRYNLEGNQSSHEFFDKATVSSNIGFEVIGNIHENPELLEDK